MHDIMRRKQRVCAAIAGGKFVVAEFAQPESARPHIRPIATTGASPRLTIDTPPEKAVPETASNRFDAAGQQGELTSPQDATVRPVIGRAHRN